jgi:hypothetical protein
MARHVSEDVHGSHRQSCFLQWGMGGGGVILMACKRRVSPLHAFRGRNPPKNCFEQSHVWPHHPAWSGKFSLDFSKFSSKIYLSISPRTHGGSSGGIRPLFVQKHFSRISPPERTEGRREDIDPPSFKNTFRGFFLPNARRIFGENFRGQMVEKGFPQTFPEVFGNIRRNSREGSRNGDSKFLELPPVLECRWTIRAIRVTSLFRSPRARPA